MYAGRVASLRRFKEDVREVAAGYECGLGLEGFQDIKVGDTVEAFELHQVTRHLDSRHHDAEERLSA
jgi:translation initiation factor IF-2